MDRLPKNHWMNKPNTCKKCGKEELWYDSITCRDPRWSSKDDIYVDQVKSHCRACKTAFIVLRGNAKLNVANLIDGDGIEITYQKN